MTAPFLKAALDHVLLVKDEVIVDLFERFITQYGLDDFEEMISDPDIDVVHLATPNHLHYSQAKAALLAGKHVVCEKPLATSIEDGQEMVKVCRENGVKLMYAEDWLFAPALVRAKEIIQEGGIGDILYVKAKETHNGSHSIFAQQKKYCGGGAMIHLGIHPIGFLQDTTPRIP